MQRKLVLTAAAIGLAACADSRSATAPVQSQVEANRQNGGGVAGAVYTSTNGTAGNAVIAYSRNNQGQLTRIGSFDTRGLGFGTGTDPLGSQFSVILNEDHTRLYVVNGGSNDITVFDVDRGGSLSWRQRIGSNGTTPVSLAARDGRLFVLNQGSNSVASFRVHEDGSLSEGSRQNLPAGAAGASTVRVDHRVLIVTERTTNRLDLFRLDEDGRIGRPDTVTSNGATPFGFDVGRRGLVLVSEAGPNAVSTYRVHDEHVRLDDGSVPTGGKATCWLRLSPDERFAFTANAGSASITAFAVDGNGTIAQESIGTLAAGAAPLDLDVTADNRFVYAVEAGTQGIGAFAIGGDGHLTALSGATGVGGFEGLAAF
ncbi:MAG TPA: beta-propeller fold lactonase family protein [Gemmatimonadaceae bacterium]|nr:beta-propeller fold lactonase family protein [Gemmatimonadaceae bacterium]